VLGTEIILRGAGRGFSMPGLPGVFSGNSAGIFASVVCGKLEHRELVFSGAVT
jgi:hypothetical protein